MTNDKRHLGHIQMNGRRHGGFQDDFLEKMAFAGRRLQGSLLRSERTWGGVGPMLLLMTQMYGPAAFRNRDCAWVLEVADMYPACLIGSRAVALMGIRTHRWSH